MTMEERVNRLEKSLGKTTRSQGTEQTGRRQCPGANCEQPDAEGHAKAIAFHDRRMASTGESMKDLDLRISRPGAASGSSCGPPGNRVFCGIASFLSGGDAPRLPRKQVELKS